MPGDDVFGVLVIMLFYTGFWCSDLESGCDTTENIPSWFDWVWYLVWYNVNANVSVDDPISFTFYPVWCPDL